MRRTRRSSQRTLRSQRIYYAHSKPIYGRPQEVRELRRIRRHFPDKTIINPADYKNDPEKRQNTMAFCFRLVRKCGLVVWSRWQRVVTSGVGQEIEHALKLGRPVFELRKDRLVRTRRPVKYLSLSATLRLYYS